MEVVTMFVTVAEAARKLGRSDESIRKLVNRHPDEVTRRDAGDGHRYTVDLEDVRRLVAEVGR
jgi:transposase-like protein